MPRSNGTYTPPAGSTATGGQPISSAAHNALVADLSTAITQSIATDGTSTVTGNIPMAGNKLTGLGAPTNPNDSARLIDVQSIPVGSAVRNTVVIGDNANGAPAFLTTGSGLKPSFTAINLPLVITFANGFTSQGASDFVSALSGGASLVAIAASCISYLAATYVDASNVTWSATKAPPQYGTAYNQAAQSSLPLNNSSLDDFGSAWTASLTYANSSPAIPATYYGVFNGSSNYVSHNSLTTFFPPNSGGGFSLRGFFSFASFAAFNTIFNAYNAAGYGLNFYANTSGKIAAQLSNSGTSWDITNNTAGSATLSTGTWYFLEITLDPVSGKYFIYVNGNLDQTINVGSLICNFQTLQIGRQWTGTAFGGYLSGTAQGIEFLPYCDHPNGVAYTKPTALVNVGATGYASDWLDTENWLMKSVSAASVASGSNPTFTILRKCYVGEASASASAITSVTAYQFNQTGKNGAGLINAFGFGQSNINVTSQRSAGTYYVNTDPLPRLVTITFILSSGGSAYVDFGSNQFRVGYNANSSNIVVPVTFMVPPGKIYRFSGATVETWMEGKK